MPWQEVNLKELALKYRTNIHEIREKQKLMMFIKNLRKKQGLSQTDLAQKIGVSQGRIAQIESGIGTKNITFDVLLNIITMLGYEYKVVTLKAG